MIDYLETEIKKINEQYCASELRQLNKTIKFKCRGRRMADGYLFGLLEKLDLLVIQYSDYEKSACMRAEYDLSRV